MNELINLQEYYDMIFLEKVNCSTDYQIMSFLFRSSLLNLESIIVELAK